MAVERAPSLKAVSDVQEWSAQLRTVVTGMSNGVMALLDDFSKADKAPDAAQVGR